MPTPKKFKVWIDGSATIGGYTEVEYDPDTENPVTTQKEAEQSIKDNGLSPGDVDWEIQEVHMVILDGVDV